MTSTTPSAEKTEREHVLSEDCWCNPVVEYYGMPFVPFTKGGGKAPPKGKKKKAGVEPKSAEKPNPFAAKKTRRSPF